MSAVGPRGTLLLTDTAVMNEAFSTLAQNVIAGSEGGRSLVITSPAAGDGKTTVCGNLALALAQTDKRVAVLDCNLDRPHLHRLFGEPNFSGLTMAIEDGKGIEAFGVQVAPQLLMVPAGPIHPNPPAIWNSEEFLGEIERMRTVFDYVLLDAPVAKVVLENPVLTTGFEGMILVVNAAQTPKKLARNTVDDLLDAGANLMGIVLNDQPKL